MGSLGFFSLVGPGGGRSSSARSGPGGSPSSPSRALIARPVPRRSICRSPARKCCRPSRSARRTRPRGRAGSMRRAAGPRCRPGGDLAAGGRRYPSRPGCRRMIDAKVDAGLRAEGELSGVAQGKRTATSPPASHSPRRRVCLPACWPASSRVRYVRSKVTVMNASEDTRSHGAGRGAPGLLSSDAAVRRCPTSPPGCRPRR